MIDPTDLFHPSPAPHYIISQYKICRHLYGYCILYSRHRDKPFLLHHNYLFCDSVSPAKSKCCRNRYSRLFIMTNMHTGWGNRGLSWESIPVFGWIDWKRHCVLQIEIWAGYLLNWNKTYYTLDFVREFFLFLPTDSHATNKIYKFILSRQLTRHFLHKMHLLMKLTRFECMHHSYLCRYVGYRHLSLFSTSSPRNIMKSSFHSPLHLLVIRSV